MRGGQSLDGGTQPPVAEIELRQRSAGQQAGKAAQLGAPRRQRPPDDAGANTPPEARRAAMSSGASMNVARCTRYRSAR